MSRRVELSALAQLVLVQGAWPLSLKAAEDIVLHYFVDASGRLASKQRLLRKLGLTPDYFPVRLAQEHAALHATAALAELQLLGLAEAKDVGPGAVFVRPEGEALAVPRGRRTTYARTKAGAALCAQLVGHTASALRKGGWP